MSLNARITPTGHFKMTRIKASNMEVIEEVEFDNLITNIGIDRFGVDSYDSARNVGGWLIPVMYVGSGNATPAVTDTAMAGQVAWTSTIQSAVGTPIITGNGGHRWVVTYRFAMGTAAGTLAEVGTGWGSPSSANSLFSRALIRDMSGNPTTLTILSDEILDVTYTITINYPPESTGTIVLNGQTHTWVMRSAEADIMPTQFVSQTSIRGYTHPSYDGNYESSIRYLNNVEAWAGGATLGTITGAPSGTSLGALPASFVSTDGVYNSSLKTITYSVGADLNSWNHANGIGVIAFGFSQSKYMGNNFDSSTYSSMFKFQISFNPPIPKTASQRLRLDFNLTFSNT